MNPVSIPNKGRSIKTPAIEAPNTANMGAAKKTPFEPCFGSMVSLTNNNFIKVKLKVIDEKL